MLFRSADFDCQVAHDGLEGKRLLDWAEVVLVDGRFPHNTEFYASLQDSGKPFIIFSGSPSCSGVGELAFILKPDMPKLKQAILLFL